MKKILSDYYKHYLSAILSNILLLIFIPILFAFNNFSSESMWDIIIIAIYCIAFALGLWSLFDNFIMTPFRLKKKLSEMSESERSNMLAEYPEAKFVNKHRYMNEHFIFFYTHRIYLLRYADIKTAELAQNCLMLTVDGHKKPLRMPFPQYGTNAVALAFLRSKNPEIKIIGNADRKETSV
ncbi:MAG: hypothetical protein IJZ47_10955 [Oscillospiraceae bacterium]|nr:hypothetical protein [Oscillospiraceae bacterium]